MIKNLVIPTYLFDGLGIAVRAKYVEDLNVFMIRMDNEWASERIITAKNKEDWLSLGSGIVDVYDVEKGLKKLSNLNPEETFILFDFNYGYKLAEKIKEMGFRGLMPTKWDRQMEKDRDMAQEFVKKNYTEIKIPEKYEFKRVDEFFSFIKENPNNYVIKPNNPDLSTFVPPKEPNQAIEEMAAFCDKNKVELEKSGFIIQRRILNGFEITPEVIFDINGNPVYSSVDIEYKRFGNYGTSFMNGCAADLVFPVDINSDIIKKAVAPIFPFVKERVSSPIIFWDAALMYDLDMNELYFLEFCSGRFGINSFYTEIELFGSIRNFIDLVLGNNPEVDRENFASSIRLFNPNYKEQTLIFPPKLNSHEYLLDAKKDGDFVTTTKFSGDAVILTNKDDNPFSSLRGVQDMAFQEKWVEFYKRSDLTSTGFQESILDRYEKSLELGLFDVNIEL
jgi:hypothetical protein